MNIPMKLPSILVSAILSLSTSLNAAVLYSENFNSAPVGSWVGYGGWGGTDIPQVVSYGGDKRGVFVTSDTAAATIALSLGTNYGLDHQAYRFSFDISGFMSRPFQVTLTDSRSNRLGLQFSDSANSRSISAVTVVGSTMTTHTTGGWSASSGWPTGFDAETLYKVHIDINGSLSAVDIDGQELGAKKARVIYNANNSSMASYVIEFDLPEDFISISGLRFSKDARYDQVRTLDNMTLTSYAIPETSTNVAILSGFAVLGLYSAFRKKGSTPRMSA
jgi:hypothetical protein